MPRSHVGGCCDGDKIGKLFLFPELHVLIGWFHQNFGENWVRHDGKDVISGNGFNHHGSRGDVINAGAQSKGCYGEFQYAILWAWIGHGQT